MLVLVLLAFVAIAGLTVLGLQRYVRLQTVPPFVLIPLFLAVYIPFSIVVLVPIDLMSSSQTTQPLFYLSERVRLVIWRVVYWLAFVLTWAILPILQSYVDSGFHEPSRKVVDALHMNLRYQLLLLGSGMVGLLYVIATSGLSLTSIRALVIALSHSYALVIALWLLGHGIVNLPRGLWTHADPNDKLNSNYRQASRVCDAFADSQSNYADVCAEITSLKRFKNDSPHLEWIDELIDEVEQDVASTRGLGRGTSRVVVADRTMVNEEYLSALSKRLKRTKTRYMRGEADWQKLLRDCAFAEDIVAAKQAAADSSGMSGLTGEPVLQFRFTRTRIPAAVAQLYFVTLETPLKRAWAIVLAVISLGLIWSELTHGTSLSVVGLLVSNTYGLAQQLVSSLILGFMCVATFDSLARIRIFNVYALVHRTSDLSSLLFYSMYACRLTVPLSYNYLTLISSRDSVFEDFLGVSINLTPLGKYFNQWLPRLILVPVVLTAFNFYDKIKDFFGYGLSFDEDDETGGPHSVVEGRELVRRALTDPQSRYAIKHVNLVPIAPTQTQTYSESAYTDRAAAPRASFDTTDAVFESGPADRLRTFFSGLGTQLQSTVANIRGEL